jgi:TRAP-type C4-dicarboxylate transport system permease small subunit
MLNAIIQGHRLSGGKAGQLSSFLIVPLLLVVLYEVLMRYAFNAPTVWGFEATAFSTACTTCWGCPYGKCPRGHVRVDIVTSRLPPKPQAAVMLAGYLVIFMPVYGLMTWGAAKFAYTATVTNELNSTSWAPRIWPYQNRHGHEFSAPADPGLSTMLQKRENPHRKFGELAKG